MVKRNPFAARLVSRRRARPRLIRLLIFSGLTVLASCWGGKEIAVGIVTVCPLNEGNWELRVLFRDRGRGNIHYPSFRYHDYPSYDVLRVPQRLGVVPGRAITLLRYKGRAPVRVLSGQIALAADVVDIYLRVPRYSRDTPGSYTEVDYPFNGRFSLQMTCEE